MKGKSGIAGIRVRAVVLAAGYGRRLEPLTRTVPKPLFPVVGRTLLARSLARLAAVGCEAAAINLHHLGDQIRRAIGPRFARMALTYSEEPTILGTLGALYPLRDFLAPADLILILNSDTLCAWPLQALIEHHRDSGFRATLLLAARPNPDDFGGGVGIDGSGSVITLAGANAPGSPRPVRQLVFAGAQVLEPTLLSRVLPGVSDSIHNLHAPLLAEGGRLGSLVTSRRWHDMGTPRRFIEGVLEAARSGWTSRRAHVGPEVQIRACVVEHEAEVGRGARLARSVVLPGARLGEGAIAEDALIGFGAVVEAQGRVVREMIASDGSRTPLG